MISGVSHREMTHKTFGLSVKKFAGNNISNLAGQLINIGTSVCLLGYGIKEILLDSHPTWFRITPHPESPAFVQKTIRAVDWMLMMIRNQPANLLDKVRFTTHGLLMIGTGVAGAVSALHRLGAISVGSTLRFFDFAAGGLFVIGNLIYLEYNIEKFVEAVKLLADAGPQKKYAIMKLIAAAIGIISTLTYIGASIATLAAAPLLYPLLLGMIGLFTGGLRILLESYITWKTQEA